MAGSPAILVLDVGLTNCKSVVFSAEGKMLSRSSFSYPTYQPRPGWVEQDPKEWWQAVCQATRQALDGQRGLSDRIESIAVTGHMHALIALDKCREPLGRAMILGDQRSIDSAHYLTREMGLDSIYHITGARMEESMPAAKIHWLKTHAAEIFSSVDLFTGCKDFVRGRMTGDRLTDPIDACAMSLYDLQSGNWSKELLHLAGISPGQMPEISLPTASAGVLKHEAAQVLGLREGLPVVVGSGDDIEVLGSGIMTPGISIEHIGTTGSILACTTELVYDPSMSLEIYPHAAPGLWVVGGSITAAGAALVWAAEILGYEDLASVFNEDFKIIRARESNRLIFVPHIAGERCPSWNPQVRGVWLGLSAMHTKADLMRAAIEGIAHALNSILKRIESLIGVQDHVLVGDRDTDNLEWLQLRADLYGRPLGLLVTSEPTALGAMILGAVGASMYQSLQEATSRICDVKQCLEPELSSRAFLEQQYKTYEQLQAALYPVWQTLSNGTGDPQSQFTNETKS
jgi:xylulokinase